MWRGSGWLFGKRRSLMGLVFDVFRDCESRALQVPPGSRESHRPRFLPVEKGGQRAGEGTVPCVR
jgi:hypothetical protein